jgi:hypothetical protein
MSWGRVMDFGGVREIATRRRVGRGGGSWRVGRGGVEGGSRRGAETARSGCPVLEFFIKPRTVFCGTWNARGRKPFDEGTGQASKVERERERYLYYIYQNHLIILGHALP